MVFCLIMNMNIKPIFTFSLLFDLCLGLVKTSLTCSRKKHFSTIREFLGQNFVASKWKSKLRLFLKPWICQKLFPHLQPWIYSFIYWIWVAVLILLSNTLKHHILFRCCFCITFLFSKSGHYWPLWSFVLLPGDATSTVFESTGYSRGGDIACKL